MSDKLRWFVSKDFDLEYCHGLIGKSFTDGKDYWIVVNIKTEHVPTCNSHNVILTLQRSDYLLYTSAGIKLAAACYPIDGSMEQLEQTWEEIVGDSFDAEIIERIDITKAIKDIKRAIVIGLMYVPIKIAVTIANLLDAYGRYRKGPVHHHDFSFAEDETQMFLENGIEKDGYVLFRAQIVRTCVCSQYEMEPTTYTIKIGDPLQELFNLFASMPQPISMRLFESNIRSKQTQINEIHD